MKNALDRIDAERARQINEEKWTPEHDDQHRHGELADAARSYEWHADTTINTGRVCQNPPPSWPWGLGWWKPTESPARGYEKAGALYCAERDRLRRLGDNASALAMEVKVQAIAAKLARQLQKTQAAPDADPGLCCVCQKPVINVHQGGDGITVLVGEGNEPFATRGKVAQAHLECAKEKSLSWFGM
jgi:hypothetical protein